MSIRIDRERLAKDIRDKRGERSLREVADEIGVGHMTLSRVESGHYSNEYNFERILSWLGNDPTKYFIIDPDDQSPEAIQLRAMKGMSAETAAAFMDVIRAIYGQISSDGNTESP